MNSKLEQDDGGKAHGKNKSEEGAIVIVQGNISPERWICMLGARENPLYSSAVVILRYDLRCVPRCRQRSVWMVKSLGRTLFLFLGPR